MTNKKVIRKAPIAGAFTIVHHAILLDKRLSPTAFRVMLCILMDADNFRLSQTLLINRLGMQKKTIQNALKKLEECGYLRRKDLNRGDYYIISEYGNLAEKDVDTPTSERNSILEESSTAETKSGRSITEPEIHFVLNCLSSKGSDRHFEKVVAEFDSELSNGSITAITEAMILKKILALPKIKTELPSDLGQIRQLYKNPELFDELLLFVQANAGGHMITQHAKDNIVLRTMAKFADAEDDLNDKSVRKYILTIKGEYTNAGKLDQRYQN